MSYAIVLAMKNVKSLLNVVNFGSNKLLYSIILSKLGKSFFEVMTLALIVPILNGKLPQTLFGLENFLNTISPDRAPFYFLTCGTLYALFRYLSLERHARLYAAVMSKIRERVLSLIEIKQSDLFKQFSSQGLNYFFTQESKVLARGYSAIPELGADLLAATLYASLILILAPIQFSIAAFFALIIFMAYKKVSPHSKKSSDSLLHQARELNQESQVLFNSYSSWENIFNLNLFKKRLLAIIHKNAEFEYQAPQLRDFASFIYEFAGISFISVFFYVSSRQSLDSAVAVLMLGIFFRLNPLLVNIQKNFMGLHMSGQAMAYLKTLEDYCAVPFQDGDFKKIAHSPNLILEGEVAYGSKVIFPNLKLSFENGVKYAIIGESGAGKSTILKSLVGATSVTSVGHVKARLMFQGILVVREKPDIFKGSIEENISLYENYSQDEISKALEITGFAEVLKKLNLNLESPIHPNMLPFSFGELQRLNIARALLKNPNWLFMDESLGNLDYLNQMTILNQISAHYPSLNIVLVTHHYHTLKFFHKVLVVNNNNRTVEMMSYEDLKQSHQSPLTNYINSFLGKD